MLEPVLLGLLATSFQIPLDNSSSVEIAQRQWSWAESIPFGRAGKPFQPLGGHLFSTALQNIASRVSRWFPPTGSGSWPAPWPIGVWVSQWRTRLVGEGSLPCGSLGDRRSEDLKRMRRKGKGVACLSFCSFSFPLVSPVVCLLDCNWHLHLPRPHIFWWPWVLNTGWQLPSKAMTGLFEESPQVHWWIHPPSLSYPFEIL